MIDPPKNFQDFLLNHWPHLVAEVRLNTKLLFCIVAAIIGGAVAVIIAGYVLVILIAILVFVKLFKR